MSETLPIDSLFPSSEDDLFNPCGPKMDVKESGDDCKDSLDLSQYARSAPPLNQLNHESIEKALQSQWLSLVETDDCKDHAEQQAKSAEPVDDLNLDEFQSQWLALCDNEENEDDFANASPEVLDTAEAFYFGNSASPEFCSSEAEDEEAADNMLDAELDMDLDEAIAKDHEEQEQEALEVQFQPLPIDESSEPPMPPPINYALTTTHSGTSHVSLSPGLSPQSYQPSPPMKPCVEPPMGNPLPDFAAMRMGDILPMSLTIRELVDFDLIGRFMSSNAGSRYVQRIMQSISGQHDEECEVVSVLLHHLLHRDDRLLWHLSTSVYGNYLVQVLCKKMNKAGNRVLVQEMLDTFLFPSARVLSVARYGCRVVQTALENFLRAQQIEFVEHYKAQCETAKAEGREQAVPYNSTDGSHVLQAIIALRLPVARVAFIKEALEADLQAASSDVSGCRVVQCFVNTYPTELDVSSLLTKRSHLALSTKEYSNYVVQCVADKVPTFRTRLIGDVFHQRNLYRLGTDKHGSNVLEKCVQLATQEQRARLIHVLKAKRPKRCSLLKVLAWDKFGNYVVSTLLDCCDREQRREVVEAMHERVVDLSIDCDAQRYGHSRDLVNKCKNIRRMGGAYAAKASRSRGAGKSRQSRGEQPPRRRGGQSEEVVRAGYKSRCKRYRRKNKKSRTKSGSGPFV